MLGEDEDNDEDKDGDEGDRQDDDGEEACTQARAHIKLEASPFNT